MTVGAVVVGAVVVGVVVVGVVVVGVDGELFADASVEGVEVVAPEVVDVVDPVVVVALEVADELAPGCSLATTIPISVVAPAAATTDVRVRRRRRTCACARDSGEFSLLFISCAYIFSSAHAHPIVPASRQAQSSLWTSCESIGGSACSNHRDQALRQHEADQNLRPAQQAPAGKIPEAE